jgi:hypothetical protein
LTLIQSLRRSKAYSLTSALRFGVQRLEIWNAVRTKHHGLAPRPRLTQSQRGIDNQRVAGGAPSDKQLSYR